MTELPQLAYVTRIWAGATAEEREAVRLLALDGYNVKCIARQTNVSMTVVYRRLLRLQRATGARSREQLIAWIVGAGCMAPEG